MTEPYDARLTVTGSGDPLVLVPGLDGTGLLFYRQIPLLAQSFNVASYALRDSAAAMDVLVEDLRQVVDAIAPAKGAFVVGESFGGALAMSFALAHPERVRGLVVLNSFPHLSPKIRLHAGLWALRAMPWGAMPIVRRLTAARLHSRHTHRTEIRRFMELTARTTREGYMNRLRILTQYDIRDRLAQLGRPTLFLASEEDHLVPSVRQARFMASRVPGAVVRILDGHGHICLIAPDIDLSQILAEWGEVRKTVR